MMVLSEGLEDMNGSFTEIVLMILSCNCTVNGLNVPLEFQHINIVHSKVDSQIDFLIENKKLH